MQITSILLESLGMSKSDSSMVGDRRNLGRPFRRGHTLPVANLFLTIETAKHPDHAFECSL